MRLLHLTTFHLEEFYDAAIPPYAILSHTWEANQEMTLEDMKQLHPKFRASHKKTETSAIVSNVILRSNKTSGYKKIMDFCKAAAQDGLTYGWVDTCCIDKTSSSELSEAINSMYRWYQRAEVCYAYLSDVPWDFDESNPYLERQSFARAAFMDSRWFMRGWTLQELIAPASLIFFGKDWQELGTKRSLRKIVSEVTGIQEGVLKGLGTDQYSVAQKMSWSAKRTTSRIEDSAYCLMGLFDINMPMLYGEGDRAFIRLQEEIIRTTNDHSILVWSSTRRSTIGGVLARSPAAFANSGHIVKVDHGNEYSPMIIGLTNKGVHLRVEVSRDHDNTIDNFYLCALNCREARQPSQVIVICLAKTEVGGDMYSKHAFPDSASAWTTLDNPNWPHRQSIYDPATQADAYIPQHPSEQPSSSFEDFHVEMRSLKLVTMNLYPLRWSAMEGSIAVRGGFDSRPGVWLPVLGKGRFAGIHLTTEDTKNVQDSATSFVVMLERRIDVPGLLASIFIPDPSELWTDTVLRLVKGLTGRPRPYIGPGDRVSLQAGSQRVNVVIRRKMINDTRRSVVEISLNEAQTTVNVTPASILEVGRVVV